MNNIGIHWTNAEDIQLKKLFLKYKMDISEISKIHKRSFEEIKVRLLKLNLIEEEGNFIKKEVNKLMYLGEECSITDIFCKVMSKHFLEQNEKIKLLELKLELFERKFSGVTTLCEIMSTELLLFKDQIDILNDKSNSYASLYELD